MGRAKIKKKSTFIDMTAMSDERAGTGYHSGVRIRD